MTDDEERMILAAFACGFKDAGEGQLICTKEQLVNYTTAVAKSVVEQLASIKF